MLEILTTKRPYPVQVARLFIRITPPGHTLEPFSLWTLRLSTLLDTERQCLERFFNYHHIGKREMDGCNLHVSELVFVLECAYTPHKAYTRRGTLLQSANITVLVGKKDSNANSEHMGVRARASSKQPALS